MYNIDNNMDVPPPKSRNTEQGRIREIDVLRGIAIVLMITGHSFIVHPINISDISWCITLHKWIYAFHMELFFLLAGCVYHCSNYRKYISKKIDRLAIPYLFFGIITLLMHSVGLEVVNKQTGIGEGIIKMLTQGGNYWFLYTLFILYLVYPFIEKVCKKPWMEVGWGILCMALVEFVKLPSLFEISRVFYYAPYFILGRYLVKFLKSDKANSHWLNAGIIIVSLAIYIGCDRLIDAYPDVVSIKYVRAIAIMFVMYVPVHYLLCFVDNGIRIAKIVERFLNNCSTYSLQLYLFNGFLLVVIRTVLVSVMHIHNPVVIVVSIVAGNLLVTLLICNYLLPKTKWLAWLCGTGKRPFSKKE